MKRISAYWSTLGGKLDEFSLQARIFHAISLISIVLLFCSVFSNYIIGSGGLAMLMAALVVILGISYYLSRVAKRFMLALSLFLVTSQLSLVVNYYYNSGISGPTYSLFLLFFIMTIAVVPPRQFIFWFTLNVVSLLSLLFIEYQHPSFGSLNYNTRLGRFADMGFTYVAIMAMILIIASFIVREFTRIHNISILKNRELEVSNDTKNKLLSILAHDLRDPLASVQGFLELLCEVDLSAEEREPIEKTLLKRTKETSFLLSNLLSWTKGQMQAVSVNISQLNIHKTTAEAIYPVLSIANEKDLDVINDTDPQHHVNGDIDMLQIVLRNLITNAIKFSTPGSVIRVSSEIDGGECRINVIDSGLGISAEKQKTLFSIAGTPTYGTANERGAGLGLLLCRDFIRHQHGKIGFTSIEGAGSTFFIQLPLASFKNPNESVDKLELSEPA